MYTDELTEYRRQLHAIRADVTRAAALTDAQFAWRPAPGNWSVGECLTHLNLFGSQVAETVTEMLAEAKSRGWLRPGPYRHPLPGRLLLWSVEPPYKLRFKAVKRLVPMPAQPKLAVLAEFQALQDRPEQLLADASGVDLASIRRPLPPTGLRQAEQIRRQPGFPR